MRTVNIEIWQRSRIWNPPEDEKFALRLKVYASQEEIEKIRATIFKLEKKEGA